MTDQQELITLAVQIADASAMSDIQMFCAHEQSSLDPLDAWWNTGALLDDIDEEYVVRAVRYLDLKGELEHHPANAKLVRKRAPGE